MHVRLFKVFKQFCYSKPYNKISNNRNNITQANVTLENAIIHKNDIM